MKTDDEILSLWTGAGGAFAQTAMMPREQLLVFLRALVDGVLAGGRTAVGVLSDPTLVTDQMLICEVRERYLEDEFETHDEGFGHDGRVIGAGYDETEAEAMYYAIDELAHLRHLASVRKLAGKIA